ncbi:MAG: zinc-ribbon domain-containing protein [Spirochaetes bacterium]|nr:zinc-ribbon domain-containing protein [Spirochaetota bacterium]
MIVRCTSCKSAFAVDDDKVMGKKFAFTCPKCDHENIIDNRKEAVASMTGPTVIDEAHNETPARSSRDKAAIGTGPESMFDEVPAPHVPERAAKRDLLADDEMLLDDSVMVDTDDLSGLAEPEKIEGMDTSIDHSDLPPADDMRSDVPLDDLNIDDDLKDLGITDIDLETEETHPKKKGKTAGKEEDSITFDDLDLDIDTGASDSSLILDEMEPKSVAEEPIELDEIDDIEKLLAEDEKKKEIIDDFEPLEVESEHIASKRLEPDMVLDEEIQTEEVYRAKDSMEDESITIDLDNLDIDLEEGGDVTDKPKGKATAAPGGAEKEGVLHDDEDESITIDIDNLDIDLEEGGDVTDKPKGKATAASGGAEKEGVLHDDEDESITIDLDNLDIDLEEGGDVTDKPKGKATAAPGGAEKEGMLHEDEDESITIDIDNLDIDLEEGGDVTDKPKGKATAAPGGAEKEGMLHEDEDESITIDIDTLDIDLEESKEISKGESHEELDLDLSDFSEETIQELEEVGKAPKDKDDEDITLDLNTLDISLEESNEIKKGEDLDEDEKLTLEDAGLTIEELTNDELITVSSKGEEKQDEDDFALSVDDMGPDIDMNQIEKELKEAESILVEQPRKKKDLLVVDELSDLPEIDFDKDLELIGVESGASKAAGAGIAIGAGMAAGAGISAISKNEDELFKLDDREKGIPGQGGLQKKIPDMVTRGAVNFSIDYSIKYSRFGAVLRLFGLFFLALIPHYIVFFVYNVLSIILGFINHIVVIFTEKNIEDFSEIHENTLRYLLSISASSIGIVEEMPIYAGRDNIDYPLQMRIVFPLRSSRLLAFLRLSGIGIILLTLPHLVIMGLMSIVIPIVFIVGILSVLITGGWPHVLFDFMTRYYQYVARVLAFSIGIIDVYPKFKFD